MRTAATIVQMLVRGLGLTQIVLGLLFWTGNQLQLIPIHMLVGLTFVLGLWVLAGLAGFSGVHLGLVALAVVWGLVVPALGMTQSQLLPGDFHWVVQVIHLAVGLAAMGLSERLAAAIRSRRGLARAEATG